MTRKPGSKQLILEFFLRNIGKVLESRDIQKASGGCEAQFLWFSRDAVHDPAERERSATSRGVLMIMQNEEIAEKLPHTSRRVSRWPLQIPPALRVSYWCNASGKS